MIIDDLTIHNKIYPKDKLVEIYRKGKEAQFVYIPSNYRGPIAMDAVIGQPESTNLEEFDRLNCVMGNDSSYVHDERL